MQAKVGAKAQVAFFRSVVHAAFLRACFFRQPPEGDFAAALAYNVSVPQEIRENYQEFWPAMA